MEDCRFLGRYSERSKIGLAANNADNFFLAAALCPPVNFEVLSVELRVDCRGSVYSVV